MTITIHDDVEQGSDEWLAMRCGMLTASDVKLILTPTLKAASNEKERQHVYEMIAQRITRYVEPSYIGDDMLRGIEDEIHARDLYSKTYALVQEGGLITNDQFGFTMGYSPDGLVGDDGLIEVKSRRQKYQVETVITGVPPVEHMLQLQAALLISGRKWIDYVSYSGGMHMVVIRVLPDVAMKNAIVHAASAFENRVRAGVKAYHAAVNANGARAVMTERRVEQEMTV